MESRKTAVEWLVEALSIEQYFPYGVPKELFNQAKEIEKEQICNAFESGEVCTLFKNEGNAIDYYNETYGK